MKAQRFYPKQVLRRLQGEHQKLDAGQVAAVKYTMLKGRKLGIAMSMGPTTTAADLLACTSRATAQAVLANSNTRIILKGAV